MRNIIPTRKRKPVIALICEGRNKTERTFFEHFRKSSAPYNLKIINSEATDIVNMAKKADSVFKEFNIDKSSGEHVFCLIDLDLEQNKLQKLLKMQKQFKNVEFIVSNPCFEIWLLFYFTANPKVENSSQKVKEQLCKYVPNYCENMDIVAIMDLFKKHMNAINRSEKKNNLFGDKALFERNPYTEVQNVLKILMGYNST